MLYCRANTFGSEDVMTHFVNEDIRHIIYTSKFLASPVEPNLFGWNIIEARDVILENVTTDENNSARWRDVFPTICKLCNMPGMPEFKLTQTCRAVGRSANVVDVRLGDLFVEIRKTE